MLVVYDSKTGNVKRFVEKLGMRAVQLSESLHIEEPFVLITYTTGFGQIPEKVIHFLRHNYRYMVGVSASGNRNWGASFGKSADSISARYGVPVLTKFELSGSLEDVKRFEKEVSALAAC
ncbi:class Ib ribonucleoside-diphosphate reductase assembly flavoprotein NrdI [Paenibacillus sp. GCM10012307]|uniref:Protein NrdI n=1 Tax=Paenibacillus roseus TaxID=2798579 RepID=A0A934J6B5_9BACL|nr:class Ib ribonucleoside-diphosphate reductase assembly flavoprotein NrdI [Paenibacillus roseus]MBJ6361566.1 class Ib ribonucleoside-diphosphate reductase assembly flavoprotein NrdI [Paenibacillus roseus]